MTLTRRPTGRGTVHIPHEDPDAPGCCIHCRRPLDAKTDRHVADVADLPAPDPDSAAAERRRIGERG